MRTSALTEKISQQGRALAVAALAASAVFAGEPVVIRGTVVDSQGSPLPGAVVRAVADGLQEPLVTTTEEKGTFALTAPDREMTYRIECSLDGYVTASASVQPTPQGSLTLDITLPRRSEQAPPSDPDVETPAGDERAATMTEERAAAITVFNEGVNALQAEDLTTALTSFQRAAELDPEFAEAHRGIAAVALQTEQYAIAADAAERFLELEPDSVDAIGTAYYAELMIGDTERMVVSARRLAEANPEVASNEMLQHSVALFESNENAQSRALLEVILDRHPDHAEAQLQLGLVCNALGDVPCTTSALDRFLELAPDDPNAPTAQALLEYARSQQ